MTDLSSVRVAVMSLQGPILVIAEQKHPDLVAALGEAGAFPVVEMAFADAPNAVGRIEPAAVLLPDLISPPDQIMLEKLRRAIEAMRTPYMPVIARVTERSGPAIPDALPISSDATLPRIIARLGSALRVRTLQVTAIRRAEALAGECTDLPVLPDGDALDDATVLVTGRGRTYPALTTAVGERVGLIGALGIETAAQHINARDVDGIVIGEGFSPRAVEAFLVALAEDTRFRDLPVAMLPELPEAVDDGRLPTLARIDGDPAQVIERMLPLVRQHAFEARLQRHLAAVEAKGMLDGQTGLFTIAAFLRDLGRSVQDAHERGIAMSLARFSFPPMMDRRTNLDAARLVSRLVRSVDFACRASDGSILLCFAGSDLRSAHVVARRIASVLRHTMLTPEGGDRIDPSVTLAAFKGTDTVESLLARVSESSTVAAE
jgi:hypothetical protein